jgi:predicted phosphoribosyltransferase
MVYLENHGPLYRDRHDAGRMLAPRLAAYAERDDAIVLGLPRGGVIVAYEVANALDLPFDVLVVRKLGAPQNEEFAIGAMASGGVAILDRDLIHGLRITSAELDRLVTRERQELERRERLYREGRPFPDLRNRVVLIVDDGLATGSTMRAAVDALREYAPARIVVAAPVGSREACEMLAQVADECVCGATPEPFQGVGLWYQDFAQTGDAEVLALLERARKREFDAARATHGESRSAT